MKEKEIYIAKKIEGEKPCPILIYRDGIYIREYVTNRILYNTQTKEKIFKLIFGENVIMQMHKDKAGKYIIANEETISSYLECFNIKGLKETKNNRIKKMIYDLLLTSNPIENEIYRVQLSAVTEIRKKKNQDLTDLKSVLKLRESTKELREILVYFENGIAKELITGRTITYITKENVKISQRKRRLEEKVIPGESQSVFFVVTNESPILIAHQGKIEEYQKPQSLGNINLDLTYIFSVGNEMCKAAIEKSNQNIKKHNLKKQLFNI